MARNRAAEQRVRVPAQAAPSSLRALCEIDALCARAI
jgi:hypothetical protein